MEFRSEKLGNGLSILAEVNPAAASMAAGFFVRAGSCDETPDIAGVSHFLEHMVFKGTDRLDALDVNRLFDGMGANYNAATSEQGTVYYAAVLPRFQDQLLELLCQLMRPSLRPEDFELEKAVILEEIALYEDQPYYRLHDKLMEVHFEAHPLGKSVLGTTESIRSMQLGAMRRYFEHRYSPGNMSLVATGNLNFDRLVETAERMCGSWQPLEAQRAMPDPPRRPARCVICDGKVAREHLGWLCAAPAARDDQCYAAELIAAILGDAAGSRLFYALLEPGIADEASVAYRPFDAAGVYHTYVSCDPHRASRVERIVRDELERFAADGPDGRELDAAKNKIASAATLAGELPLGRVHMIGGDWLAARGYMPLERHIERLFAVTRDEIMETLGRWNISAASMVALGPLERL